jgi:DNA-binding transcriptional regulator YhcF (GntR family)
MADIMRGWPPQIQGTEGPIYLAIADAVGAAVAAGELRPSDRLPTHRALANALGVALSTVTRGYAEAFQRGLLEGTIGRGTFVRATGQAPRTATNSAKGAPDLQMNLHITGKTGASRRGRQAASKNGVKGEAQGSRGMTELTAKALVALDLIASEMPGQFSAEVETIRSALEAKAPSAARLHLAKQILQSPLSRPDGQPAMFLILEERLERYRETCKRAFSLLSEDEAEPRR